MTDTVQKLMGLAREWANAVAAVDTATVETNAAEVARQALHDGLTRLFTPLSDEQIERMSSVGPGEPDDWYHLSPWEYRKEMERARAAGIRIAEQAHGIGERNETRN